MTQFFVYYQGNLQKYMGLRIKLVPSHALAPYILEIMSVGHHPIMVRLKGEGFIPSRRDSKQNNKK